MLDLVHRAVGEPQTASPVRNSTVGRAAKLSQTVQGPFLDGIQPARMGLLAGCEKGGVLDMSTHLVLDTLRKAGCFPLVLPFRALGNLCASPICHFDRSASARAAEGSTRSDSTTSLVPSFPGGASAQRANQSARCGTMKDYRGVGRL